MPAGVQMAPAIPEPSAGPPAPPTPPGPNPPGGDKDDGDPAANLSRLLSWVSGSAETTTETTSDSRESTEDILKLVGDEPPRRWLDLDDNDHFLEIVNRVYAELSARLRFDLLVERERAGSLMDLG